MDGGVRRGRGSDPHTRHSRQYKVRTRSDPNKQQHFHGDQSLLPLLTAAAPHLDLLPLQLIIIIIMPRSFLVRKYIFVKKHCRRWNETPTSFFQNSPLEMQEDSSSPSHSPPILFIGNLYAPLSSSSQGPSRSPSYCSGEDEEDSERTSDPPSPKNIIPADYSHLQKDSPLARASEGSTRPLFHCKHCPKEYTSLGALKMHIRSHTLPCVCPTCGKAFSRPWLLRGHIRTHTGERPFACQHCSRAFADRSNLRAHMQTHSDVKKYQCNSCSRTFSRMSLLNKHTTAGGCSAL